MTILACTDRSENSIASLRYAKRLADALGEKLVVACVLDIWEREEGGEKFATLGDVGTEANAEGRGLAETFLADVFDELPELHVHVGHPPGERILAIAERVRARFIVAGTSGQSRLTEAFFGSTISALARSAEIPVLAVPPGFEGGVTHILAPVDFSPCSEGSLKYAGEFAKTLGADLRVQHVAPFGGPSIAPPIAYIPESPDAVVHAGAERLRDMVAAAGLTDQVVGTRTDLGPPHSEILAAVEEYDIDLVVIGTHGRTGITRFFLGSTAERLLRERTCPVLVVRHLGKA